MQRLQQCSCRSMSVSVHESFVRVYRQVQAHVACLVELPISLTWQLPVDICLGYKGNGHRACQKPLTGKAYIMKGRRRIPFVWLSLCSTCCMFSVATLGAGTSAVARWRMLEASMRVASSSSWGWILMCVLVGRRTSGAVVSSTKAAPSRRGLQS